MSFKVKKSAAKGGFRKWVFLGAAAAVMQLGTAYAQSDETSDTESSEEAESRQGVVYVTSTKRERSLQDVPISVTALSVEALDNAAITNLESLQFSVPGLTLTTAAGSGWQSSARIRGVGTSGTNIGFEGAVGIFVDGVYRPRAGAALGDIPDVQRVEVLRGPQGTLFGRNTTAGAISIVTNKPVMNELSGSARATFGSHNRLQLRGVLNAPLAEDKLAFRLAGDYNKRDGFLENIYPGLDEDLNDRDRINLRGQLLFEPNPDMELRLIANYFNTDEVCCGGSTITDGGFVVAGNAGAFEALGVPAPIAATAAELGDFKTARNTPTNEDQQESLVQADFEWDLGNGITFFNSLSYSDYEYNSFSDADQTGWDFIEADQAVTIKQFTEEFRFNGAIDDASFAKSVDWILGGYYSEEELGQSYDFVSTAGADALNAVLVGAGAPGFPPLGFSAGDTQLSILGQDAEVWALFGHLDVQLNDQWNLSGGARYTDEQKTGSGDFTTVNIGPINPFIAPGASSFEVPADAQEWIYSGALNYKWNDDISTYASYAHGYKSGGVNLDVLGGQGGADANTPRALLGNGFLSFDAVPGDPTFPIEEVDTFEVGFRSRLSDNATLNVTGFHSTFENFQILQFTGTSFNVLSAPELTAQGVEGDLQFTPVEGLDLSLQYTYVDTEYSKPFTLGATELTGRNTNNAPEHSGALTATYTRPIGNNYNGFVYGGWNFESEYDTSTTLEDSRRQDGFSMFNLRAGLSTADDKYSFEVWCRNCTDEPIAQLIFASPIADDSEFGTMHPPMEWGVTLSARF